MRARQHRPGAMSPNAFRRNDKEIRARLSEMPATNPNCGLACECPTDNLGWALLSASAP